MLPFAALFILSILKSVDSVFDFFETISFLCAGKGFVVFHDSNKKTVKIIENPVWPDHFTIFMRNTLMPRGFIQSIFQHKNKSMCMKQVLDRRFAVPVKINDTPYEIDVSVDAVITDVNKFVFYNLEMDLCRQIENELYGALSEKFANISVDVPLETLGGRILTAFDDNGVEYTVKVVRMRDMNKEIEKKKATVEILFDELEEFTSNAVLSSMDAAKKYQEMNAKINWIKYEIKEIPRTKVYRLPGTTAV